MTPEGLCSGKRSRWLAPACRLCFFTELEINDICMITFRICGNVWDGPPVPLTGLRGLERPRPRRRIQTHESGHRVDLHIWSKGLFFEKMTLFGDFREITFRCLQSPQKVAGTSLLTFLTCFWTLWRLWRLPASYFLISRGLRTSERSHGQATPGSPNHGFSWIFENFQKIMIFTEK